MYYTSKAMYASLTEIDITPINTDSTFLVFYKIV